MHIFLSHSSVDKALVRRVRAALAPYSTTTWLDEVEMRPGDSLYGKISAGIQKCDAVLAFISANSVGSKWVQRELFAFLAKEDQDSSVRVVPVLIDDTPPPPFLCDRLYVRFQGGTFGTGMRKLLTGLLPDHSVLLLAPDLACPYKLQPFEEDLRDCLKHVIGGKLHVVYDHFEFSASAVRAIADSDQIEFFPERLRAAIPRVFELITALTPRLFRVAVEYCGSDPAAPAVAQRLLQLIWRIVSLDLFDKIGRHADSDTLSAENVFSLQSAYDEVERLRSVHHNYVHPSHHIGFINTIWLEHLGVHMDNCFDITFIGNEAENDNGIYNAIHVRIPRVYIREDSLTRFDDTPPAAEFSIARWLTKVLPYIAADAIVQISFTAEDLRDCCPRIGLRREDYWRFGIT